MIEKNDRNATLVFDYTAGLILITMLIYADVIPLAPVFSPIGSQFVTRTVSISW